MDVPTSPALPAADRHALGLYISIPFCRSKCTYCNFSSGVYPAADHPRYIARLIEDLAAARDWSTGMRAQLPRRLDTIYLGGGTPSLLEPDLLATLFAAIRCQFTVEPDAEITMECAPGQLTGAMLEAMGVCGVNRASMGVQSFIDAEAHGSGRLHNLAMVESDLRRLRAAGIENLNIDLIAGLAHQTPASWEESLDALLDAGVPHASIYMLEVDEDSRLGRELLDGGARYGAGLVPDDDSIARMYERALEKLAAAGLIQYEISNFCRPGRESRHNLRYWQRRPYLGVGLDASSMLFEMLSDPSTDSRLSQALIYPEERPAASRTRHDLPSAHDDRLNEEAGSRRNSSGASAPVLGFSPTLSTPTDAAVLRFTTTDDLTAYLTGPQPAETAWLSPQRQLEEAWFLGLRLNAGVRPEALQQEFGSALVAPALETVRELVANGLLHSDDGSIRLTARGRLLSNDVFQEFLATPVA